MNKLYKLVKEYGFPITVVVLIWQAGWWQGGVDKHLSQTDIKIADLKNQIAAVDSKIDKLDEKLDRKIDNLSDQIIRILNTKRETDGANT